MISRGSRLVALLLMAVILGAPLAGAVERSTLLRLAEIHPDGHPTTQADRYFAELAEERSKGRLKVVVYAGGALGTENDAMEMARVGALELVRTSCAPLAEMFPPIGVFSLPFLFRGEDQFWAVLGGSIGRDYLEGMEKAGFIGLTYFEAGNRSFYTKTPVRSPADLKGLKIRVQESGVMMNLVAAYEALAVPMDFGEVRSALSTGVIDGAENNIPSYFTSGHYEVARFYCLDRHARIPDVLLAGKWIWQAISQEDRTLLSECARKATEFQRQAWRRYEGEALAKVKAAGCQVIEVDAAEFKRAAAPIYEKYPQYRAAVQAIEGRN